MDAKVIHMGNAPDIIIEEVQRENSKLSLFKNEARESKSSPLQSDKPSNLAAEVRNPPETEYVPNPLHSASGELPPDTQADHEQNVARNGTGDTNAGFKVAMDIIEARVEQEEDPKTPLKSFNTKIEQRT